MAETGFNTTPGFAENVVNNVASNVAGIFSTRPNAKYMSGARCTLKINGQLVGFAFGISWTINTTHTEINALDNYLPEELVPQRVTVEGTISAIHIPGTSPSTLNWQANVLSFLHQPYVSIQAQDSATQQIIFATDKAVIVSRTEDIKVDQLSNLTLRWRAIGFLDEATPQPLHNYNQPNDANTTPTRQTNPVTAAISGAVAAVGNALGI